MQPDDRQQHDRALTAIERHMHERAGSQGSMTPAGRSPWADREKVGGPARISPACLPARPPGGQLSATFQLGR
jgi:hypothetical protein